MLLSTSAYHAACSDDKAGKVNQYQELSLEDREKLKIDPESPLHGKPELLYMRLHYKRHVICTVQRLQGATREGGKDALESTVEMLPKPARGWVGSELRGRAVNLTKTSLGSDVKSKTLWARKFSSLNENEATD